MSHWTVSVRPRSHALDEQLDVGFAPQLSRSARPILHSDLFLNTERTCLSQSNDCEKRAHSLRLNGPATAAGKQPYFLPAISRFDWLPFMPTNFPHRWRRAAALCVALFLWLAGSFLNGEDELPDAFRGQSLAGWTTLDGGPVTRGWEVADGEIRLNRSAGRGGHIVTAAEFGDFDLSFEWKIAARGNSGLKYRVRKYGNQTLGLEYQISDEPEGRPVSRKSVGALYDLYEPAADRLLKPAGEWNTARIVVRGNRIEHWLNGATVVSATVGDEEWARRIGQSKFADQQQFGENR